MFAKIKESLENNVIECIVSVIFLVLNAIVIWFWGVISKSTITFKLPTVLILILFILVFISLFFVELRRRKKLSKELEDFRNPISCRLQLFNIGDQVIRTIDAKMYIPKPSTITKIENNRVYCKDGNGRIDDFAPEELHTTSETKQIIDQKEAERRHIEEENRKKNAWINW